MWYAGVDMGWQTTVIALVSDAGQWVSPRRFRNEHPLAIVEFIRKNGPFRAVIEAIGSYRWLYDLLSEYGEVVLAHPYRLRAIWSGRAKTDKLDARDLAELLRGALIPRAYVPPPEYQVLRDITGARARLTQARTRVINELRAIFARGKIRAPFIHPFGPRGLAWIESLDLDPGFSIIRDEHVARLQHFDGSLKKIDKRIEDLAPSYPQASALVSLTGFGLYTALLVVAELGEPWRFRRADQAAAYAGLTPRVYQSGQREAHGRISKQGSPWLRWILVEAAYKVTRRDEPLKRFYQRVRRRRGRQSARVAVARKLAEICWKRLMAWHKAHGG